jgi:hypothetical protein
MDDSFYYYYYLFIQRRKGNNYKARMLPRWSLIPNANGKKGRIAASKLALRVPRGAIEMTSRY